MAADLVLALALVLANAFFVAAEFAIARLRPTQVFELARDRRPGARSAQHAVEHIDSYLSACQLGITLASLGLGAVGERAFHGLLEPLLGDNARIAGFGLASAIAFLIITMLHVVLGELAPKSAAISRTVPIALALAPIMRGFYFVTKPLVDLFNGLGNLVLKPFGIPPASEAGHAPHSERRAAAAAPGEPRGRPDPARGAAALRGGAGVRRPPRPRGDDPAPSDRLRDDRGHAARGRRQGDPKRAHAAAAVRARSAGSRVRSASSTSRTCCRSPSGSPRSTRARSRGRSRTCRSRRAWTRSCARCGGTADTLRSCSTSTARSSG